MKSYGGIDLHSTINFIVSINQNGEVFFEKRLPNDIEIILSELESSSDIDSLVVESTYYWHWLVDQLYAS